MAARPESMELKRSMPNELIERLEGLYADMEREYDRIAKLAGLTCSGCPDNCCTSHFQHHTHVEWAFLWKGLLALPEERLGEIQARAENNVRRAGEMMDQGRPPDLMCPVNADGLCTLYAHRLMICRLHGVPNRFTLPDGRTRTFPGCFRCQEIVRKQASPPMLERTGFYRRLAELEMDYLRLTSTRPAKVRLTLAEMICQGPPS